MTQSVVHGSSSEGSLHRSLSISTRRAAPLSRRSVAVKRTHSDTSIASFSHHGRGLEANAPAGRRSFRRRDAVPHRLLHLLEGAHLDLARSLARDAELVGELRER